MSDAKRTLIRMTCAYTWPYSFGFVTDDVASGVL